mgnify:CR=1 FL=1
MILKGKISFIHAYDSKAGTHTLGTSPQLFGFWTTLYVIKESVQTTPVIMKVPRAINIDCAVDKFSPWHAQAQV